MKVVLATGGTGGHLFPALKVARFLRQRGDDVLFVGSFDKMPDKMKDENFRIIHCRVRGLAGVASYVPFCWLMLIGVLKARRSFKEFRPDAVIGFGGYGSFPGVIAGWLCKIPVMIHEQNVVPGKANRLAAKFAVKIALSFPQAGKYFDKKKIVFTGCPVHAQQPSLSRADILRKFNFTEGKPVILIFGGSQGSRRINQLFFDSLQLFKNKIDVQIIHVTGHDDFNGYNEKYQALSVRASVHPFLNDIGLAYAAADVVIARAGAVTVTEIDQFNVPAILIPYPYAMAHQKENAVILENKGKAVVLDEGTCTPELLHVNIERLLANASRMRRPGADTHLPTAEEKIVEALSLLI